MAPISSVLHPMWTAMQQGTARAYLHKTALLHVPLIFASRISYLVGRDRPLTQHFSMWLVFTIFIFQGRGITSPMLTSPHQMIYWSLIAVCDTTCLNGIVQRMYESSFFLRSFLTKFLVHTTPRSCSIYSTHQLAMSLSGFSGFLSSVFGSFKSYLSITCRFRPKFWLR